jgi:hypothetical protein
MTAVMVIWWIGLAGALVWTLVVVKQVLLLLRVLSSILDLARSIRGSAAAIAANLEGAAALAGLEAPARAMGEALEKAGISGPERERKAG